jgi:hypothetical protein
MSRAIPLLPLWALRGLLYGDLYLYLSLVIRQIILTYSTETLTGRFRIVFDHS